MRGLDRRRLKSIGFSSLRVRGDQQDIRRLARLTHIVHATDLSRSMFGSRSACMRRIRQFANSLSYGQPMATVGVVVQENLQRSGSFQILDEAVHALIREHATRQRRIVNILDFQPSVHGTFVPEFHLFRRRIVDSNLFHFQFLD